MVDFAPVCEGIDFSKGVEIKLGYYEPQAPSRMKVFLEEFNVSTGEYSLRLIGKEYEATGGKTENPGKTVYSNGVTSIVNNVKASYSEPAISVDTPAGCRIFNALYVKEKYWVSGEVAGYLGGKTDCVSDTASEREISRTLNTIAIRKRLTSGIRI